MDIQAEKLFLIEELVRTDDIKLIEKIKALLTNKSNPILGYNVKGELITRSQLVKQIEEAEARMDGGEFTSQEDLEKQSENW
ncbi:hypothetical protein [Pedobacter cryophilus]|uniref:Uncharacterized protein n=1 Tax=Pedobacter cryophilus TaxID=2571271 RepID=A0A4U1C666_9SPHI|nr:hypothetical protein [Pedobacter cryophilus]TKB98850.1 hypothetical protein FA046_06975 [Pedobacter cryophilus]